MIDSRCEIVYIHGRTGEYLEPAPGGRPNVLDMARGGLRSALAAVLRGSRLHRKESVTQDVRVRTNGGTTRVD